MLDGMKKGCKRVWERLGEGWKVLKERRELLRVKQVLGGEKEESWSEVASCWKVWRERKE